VGDQLGSRVRGKVMMSMSRLIAVVSLLWLTGCYGSTNGPQDGDTDLSPDANDDTPRDAPEADGPDVAVDDGHESEVTGEDVGDLDESDVFAPVEVAEDVSEDGDAPEGSGDAGARCTGTPRPCSTLYDMYQCDGFPGCDWDPYHRLCTGISAPCALMFDEESCLGHGCVWS
jgi:hypothetical protein